MQSSLEGLIFSPAQNAHTKVVDGEVLVIDTASGNYFVLNEVSGFLWQTLETKSCGVPALLSSLLEEYDITQEECSENVENFCRYMLAEKLIVTSLSAKN
ncbi:MAG: PqqD family protein [Bdellovibrionota bacterium]